MESCSDSEAYSLTEDILSYKLPAEAVSHIAHTKKHLDSYLSRRRGVNEPVKEYQRVIPIELDDVPGCAQKFEVFNLLEEFNFLRSTGSDFDFGSQEKREAEKQRAEAKVGKLTMLKEISKHTAEMQMLCEVTRQQNSKKADYCAPRTIVPESKAIFKNALEKLRNEYDRLEKTRNAATTEEWKKFGIGEYLPPHYKYLDFDRSRTEGTRSEMDSTISEIESEL